MIEFPPPQTKSSREALGRLGRAYRQDDQGILLTGREARYQADMARLISLDGARVKVSQFALEIPAGSTGTFVIGTATYGAAATILGNDIELDGLDDANKIVGLSVVAGPRSRGTALDEYSMIAGFCRLNAPNFDTSIMHVHSSPNGYFVEPVFERYPWACRRGIAQVGTDEGDDVEERIQARIVFGNLTVAALRVTWFLRALQTNQNIGTTNNGLPDYITS